MITRTVDVTAGGRLSDLIKTQFNEDPQRCASMALQNLFASGVSINFGAPGNPAHELRPGQTTVLPIGNTKNVAFAAAAVNVIVSLFSER